jgi:hypothetical protein
MCAGGIMDIIVAELTEFVQIIGCTYRKGWLQYEKKF